MPDVGEEVPGCPARLVTMTTVRSVFLPATGATETTDPWNATLGIDRARNLTRWPTSTSVTSFSETGISSEHRLAVHDLADLVPGLDELPHLVLEMMRGRRSLRWATRSRSSRPVRCRTRERSAGARSPPWPPGSSPAGCPREGRRARSRRSPGPSGRRRASSLASSNCFGATRFFSLSSRALSYSFSANATLVFCFSTSFSRRVTSSWRGPFSRSSSSAVHLAISASALFISARYSVSSSTRDQRARGDGVPFVDEDLPDGAVDLGANARPRAGKELGLVRYLELPPPEEDDDERKEENAENHERSPPPHVEPLPLLERVAEPGGPSLERARQRDEGGAAEEQNSGSLKTREQILDRFPEHKPRTPIEIDPRGQPVPPVDSLLPGGDALGLHRDRPTTTT